MTAQNLEFVLFLKTNRTLTHMAWSTTRANLAAMWAKLDDAAMDDATDLLCDAHMDLMDIGRMTTKSPDLMVAATNVAKDLGVIPSDHRTVVIFVTADGSGAGVSSVTLPMGLIDLLTSSAAPSDAAERLFDAIYDSHVAA